jgi:hypothetical protein
MIDIQIHIIFVPKVKEYLQDNSGRRFAGYVCAAHSPHMAHSPHGASCFEVLIIHEVSLHKRVLGWVERRCPPVEVVWAPARSTGRWCEPNCSGWPCCSSGRNHARTYGLVVPLHGTIRGRRARRVVRAVGKHHPSAEGQKSKCPLQHCHGAPRPAGRAAG